MIGCRARRCLARAALALVLMIGSSAGAHELPPRPLRLEHVLASVQTTHPELRASEQQMRRARGQLLEAQGGFDPTLSVSGKHRALGYYRHSELDVSVRQPTPLWGSEVHAGYRRGSGEYPIYKGELETLSAGELRAGIDVPLLRGGPIDERRARIQRSRLAELASQRGLDDQRLRLQQSAARAYFSWLGAGKALDVHRSLLRIALERGEALAAQAAAGSIAQATVLDNLRLIYDRRAKLVSAEQEFREQTLTLSLYVRDGKSRRPFQLDERWLPGEIPAPSPVIRADVSRDIQRALAARPDLSRFELERRAARVDVELAQNRVSPKLDVGAAVSRDLGDGPRRLEPAEIVVGASFEVPIPMRAARGAVQASRAQVAALEERVRYLRDTVEVDVRQAHVGLEAAAARAELAAAQLETAQLLVKVEQQRFIEGGADLVVVNLRELAAAEAALAKIAALIDYQVARADYTRATGGTR